MPFDANKLYCSEVLAILLQNSEGICIALCLFFLPQKSMSRSICDFIHKVSLSYDMKACQMALYDKVKVQSLFKERHQKQQ